MNIERLDWGNFTSALAIVNEQLASAETRSRFEPPAGLYECAVVGRSGVIFKDDAGKPSFVINVQYQITAGEFTNQTFYSQDYNFNEQGIGWTKAFVQTVAGLDEPPNTAQEISDALDMAVNEQHGVHLDVSYRTYTKKNGDQRTVLSEKILQWVGPLVSPQTNPAGNPAGEATPPMPVVETPMDSTPTLPGVNFKALT